ncbi:MAG TPA: hypothetical protein VL742_03035 [Casimicrobiaceae bacterium]|nr:hypothetical protein [Casimicrobiaceae bacterium]
MTTDKHDPEGAQAANVSRRDFIPRLMVAGLVAATGQSFAATLAIVETEVTVKTPDGICDAAFIYPAPGAYPGVIVWPDALGLRRSCTLASRRTTIGGSPTRASRRLAFQEVEVCPAKHGWCVPDMPIEDGAPIYDQAQAERASSKLVALYKTLA